MENGTNKTVRRNQLDNPKRIYRMIDLFAGAGGLTLGFSRLSKGRFQPVWANDVNEHAVNTYNANFGNHAVCGDLVALLATGETEVPSADLVVGGPPCQGFSLLNKKRDGDERRRLWRPFLDVAARSGATVFLMENVPQLLGSPEHQEILRAARALGFQTTSAKLCAADYGVPQTRHRAFILGCTFTDPHDFFPPLKTHFNPEASRQAARRLFSDHAPDARPWVTVREAIGDLPPPQETMGASAPPLDLHFGRRPSLTSLARYRAIPQEGMNRFDLQRLAPELTPACWVRKTSGGTDLFGRLWWDRPAFTIRTEFFKPEKGRYLHPEQHRPITHREAARLQSFPDDFRFLGTKIEIAKQIGNAVPPLMAARIADVIYEMLTSRESDNDGCLHCGKTQLDYVAC